MSRLMCCGSPAMSRACGCHSKGGLLPKGGGLWLLLLPPGAAVGEVISRECAGYVG